MSVSVSCSMTNIQLILSFLPDIAKQIYCKLYNKVTVSKTKTYASTVSIDKIYILRPVTY